MSQSWVLGRRTFDCLVADLLADRGIIRVVGADIGPCVAVWADLLLIFKDTGAEAVGTVTCVVERAIGRGGRIA